MSITTTCMLFIFTPTTEQATGISYIPRPESASARLAQFKATARTMVKNRET